MRPTDARAAFCAVVRADMFVLNALESVGLLRFEPEIPRAASDDRVNTFAGARVP